MWRPRAGSLCVAAGLLATTGCSRGPEPRKEGVEPRASTAASAAASPSASRAAALASSEASYARASKAGASPGSVGHYDDTGWSGLDDPAGYDDLAVDITVEAWEMGSRQDAYYYANDVKFTNGKNAYGGLQGGRYVAGKPAIKGLIFSVWDVSDGAIAEAGGTQVTFSTEGSGQSVRLPYDWQPGTTYRFKIYLDQEASSGVRLWGASVTDLGRGRTTRIGRIYVPVAFGRIRHPVTFHERDRGHKTAPCSEISPSRVRFSNMTADGGAIKATGFTHKLQRTVPDCPGINWFQDVPGGYVNGINVPHELLPR